jgi:hypothetical protein
MAYGPEAEVDYTAKAIQIVSMSGERGVPSEELARQVVKVREILAGEGQTEEAA